MSHKTRLTIVNHEYSCTALQLLLKVGKLLILYIAAAQPKLFLLFFFLPPLNVHNITNLILSCLNQSVKEI